MNFLGTEYLDSENCYLRKLEISDSKQLYENVFSDPEVSKYMSWSTYTDENSVKGYLEGWRKYYSENECYWGVFKKSDNELIGTIYLYPESINADLGFISYCFGSKFWGNGYATESVREVLKYGFKKIEYRNITTFCAESNTLSQKLLKRLGFKCEAKMRSRDKTIYGYEDCFYFSLLNSEMVEI